MQQRLKDDCAICCIAMATGKSYEYVMSKALAYGCRSKHWQGTIDVTMLLTAVGVKGYKRTDIVVPGRKSLVSFFQKREYGNTYCHMMYFDGEDYHDPSNDPILWENIYRVIEIWR